MSSGYIPQELLDEIADRCDIVSIVNEYVPLKRRGRNYQGLCPFHHEKTPSFSVSPDKKIFHCFGCGKGGNVFRFIMEIEGIPFMEAVEKLAKRAGVKLPEKEITQAQRQQLERHKRYLKINDYVARYYQRILWEKPEGAPFRAYLKQRQITRETAEKFLLGAAPQGWENLYHALQQHGVTVQEMLDLGLISASRRPGRYVDRFRQRLMFPISNERGQVIAFGGRIIDQDSSPQKYLNSPETPLFHKSRNLYGLHLARNQIRNMDMAILVEGYMDVISCHQYGITNAVAPLGTAFTAEQGRLLMRSTYQVGISLDGDSAGIKATMRCLDILADLGCTARVIQIPDGQDPDEYLKKYGQQAFEQLISDSQESIMYKITRYMETTNTDTIFGKTSVINQLLPDLKKLQSAVARESAIRQISVQLGVSEKSVWDELQKKSTSHVEKRPLAQVESAPLQVQENPVAAGKIENKVEKKILWTLFEKPDLLSAAEQFGGAVLFSEAAAALYQVFADSIRQCGKVDANRIPPDQGEQLADIAMETVPQEEAERLLRDGMLQLKLNQLNQEYQQQLRQLNRAENLGAIEEMQALQKLDSILKEKKEYEALRKGE